MNRKFAVHIAVILALIPASMTCSGPGSIETLDTYHGNPDLTGRLWRLEYFVAMDGSVFRPDPSEIYTLEFNENLTLFGDYDCNECAGNYEVGPENEITLWFSCTDMTCDTEPESPINYYYLPSLYGATSYELRGNQLCLHYRFVFGKGTLFEGDLQFIDTRVVSIPNNERLQFYY